MTDISADCYLIATASTLCPHCVKSTRVVAVGLLPGHDYSADGDDEPWTQREQQPCHAFLFYAGFLLDSVVRKLRHYAPQYRFAPRTANPEAYWANHCEHCAALLDDHDLFCEPDGAFCPASAEAAAQIRLIAVHEHLEAAAAGYAPEPEFFACMIRV